MVRENKQKILDKLTETLQLTYNANDLQCIVYHNPNRQKEQAIIQYKNGHMKTINIHMDSGTTMIADVLKAMSLL